MKLESTEEILRRILQRQRDLRYSARRSQVWSWRRVLAFVKRGRP